MQFTYLQMHGAGNRIMVIDERSTNRPPPDSGRIRQLAESGPEFDQLMWVSSPQNPAMTASYRVFNADGSEVEQCGNGVRCVAWMLSRDRGEQRTCLLESPVGIVEARHQDDGHISVSMGPPEFEPDLIPFVADSRSPRYTLALDERDIDVSVLSMGNPHCVLWIDDVATADINDLGPRVEKHPRFPAHTNVEFIRIRDRKNIELRVHERGVGETLACGTGACAAVVAAQQLGRVDESVNVHLPGGQLMVSWQGGAETVWLTGEAELVDEGTIDL